MNSARPLAFLEHDPHRTFPSAQGKALLWTPAPGLIVSRAEGFLNLEAAMAIGAEFEQQARSRVKILAFHDWEEMTSYDDQARVHLTEICRRLLPQIEGLHILLRSQIVAFGVRMANIVLKVIQVHTDRAPFEKALHEAIIKRRAPT